MSLVTLPRILLVDSNGNPRSGARLLFYASGTTTPITVYTTSAFSVAHSQPVLTAATGYAPAVYIDPSVNSTYKLVVQDPDSVELTSDDNLPVLPLHTTSTYTATGTGFSTPPTGTARYVKFGSFVTLYLPTLSGTSNATSKTVTGMPAAIRPARTIAISARVQDNGGSRVSSLVEIGTDGVMTFYPTSNGGNWTGSGAAEISQWSYSYPLV